MNAGERQYAAILEGDPEDLKDLRLDYAGSGPIRVTEIEVGGKRFTALLADEFSAQASSAGALNVAREIVAQINGLRLVARTDRRPVRPTIMHDRLDVGEWSVGTNHASGALEVGPVQIRATATVTGVDGTPIPESARPAWPAKWLAFARSGTPDGKRAADILSALSGNPDWADLWRAQEMFHHDRRQLPDWNDGDSERFRQSATLHRHSHNSRNGKDAREWFALTLEPKMDINTARQVVSRGAKLWLAWKVQ
jgi:hypothetical protein